jgi:uncharacterized protein
VAEVTSGWVLPRMKGQPRPERRKRKHRPPAPAGSWTARYSILALLGVLIIGATEGMVVLLLFGRGPLGKGLSGILLDLTLLAALIPLYRRQPFRPRDLGLRRAPPAASVGWVLLAVIVIGLTNWLWLNQLLGMRTGGSLGVTLHGSTLGLVLTGVFMAGTAPVVEEIFFRGVLYRSLRNTRGVALAAGITGVIFALVHGLTYPLGTLPPRLVFGVITCLLYERTGSLLPGIAVHCLIDGSGYVTALTGHDHIVFPAFIALGVVLLVYRGIRLLVVPSELPQARSHPSRT